MKSKLVKWQNIENGTKREIEARYVHWKYDTTVSNFEQWAQQHAFYIRRDGKLDDRYNHCEPDYLADYAN
jgi:hypothetical protein